MKLTDVEAVIGKATLTFEPDPRQCSKCRSSAAITSTLDYALVMPIRSCSAEKLAAVLIHTAFSMIDYDSRALHLTETPACGIRQHQRACRQRCP